MPILEIDRERIRNQQKKRVAKAAKEAVDADREKLASFRDEFPDDLEFAVEQFQAGVSLVEARAAFAYVLKDRLAEAIKKPPQQKSSCGAPPTPFGESLQGPITDDVLCEQIRAMSKDEGISIKEARHRLRDINPASRKSVI